MDVNFDANNIIFVCFEPGIAGSFISKLLALSNEVAIPKSLQEKDIFNFKRHRKGVTLNASASHDWIYTWIDPLELERDLYHDKFPYWIYDNDEIKKYIQKNSSPTFQLLTNSQTKKLVITAHDFNHLDVFPKSKRLFITYKNLNFRHFQIRAVFEKVTIPVAIERDDIITRNHIYNENYNRFFKPKSLPENDQTYHVFLDNIFSNSILKYTELCSFLDITPSKDFEKLVNIYIEGQWKRPNKQVDKI